VPVTARRDTEYTEYVSARLPSLRRLALMLCHDWQSADDLVQAAIVRLYVKWGKASAADNPDAYARAILFREFLHERRTGWARRVRLGGDIPAEPAVAAIDQDAALDLQAAVATLPPRQRAAPVLRFYCDLSIETSAEVLGCSPGTVKSQTARALDSLRRALRSDDSASPHQVSHPDHSRVAPGIDQAAGNGNTHGETLHA
jgi:RNA polymerase sigma-70 factor (sigma-E family)